MSEYKENVVLKEKYPVLVNVRKIFPYRTQAKRVREIALKLHKFWQNMTKANKDLFRKTFPSFMMSCKESRSLWRNKRCKSVQWLLGGKDDEDGMHAENAQNIDVDDEFFRLVTWLLFRITSEEIEILEEKFSDIYDSKTELDTELDKIDELVIGYKEIFGELSGRIKKMGKIMSQQEYEETLKTIFNSEAFRNQRIYQECLETILNYANFTTPKTDTAHTQHYI